MRIVAIDGPSGSGKSTVARAVAEKLGLAYLDSGAMYRAVAYAAICHGIDPDDSEAVAHLAQGIELQVGDKVLVDGMDATIEIRSPEVTRAVSIVAANPAVRHELVLRQREWAEAHRGGVIEGRDIGSVVFPTATVKIYLTADDSVRASRRSKEMLELKYDQVAADMARRDRMDSTRPTAPLVVADDAVYLDSTGSEVAEVVDEVIRLVEQSGPDATERD